MNFLSAQYNTLKISHLILFFLNVSQELCRMWATHKAESLTRLPLLFAQHVADGYSSSLWRYGILHVLALVQQVVSLQFKRKLFLERFRCAQVPGNFIVIHVFVSITAAADGADFCIQPYRPGQFRLRGQLHTEVPRIYAGSPKPVRTASHPGDERTCRGPVFCVSGHEVVGKLLRKL